MEHLDPDATARWILAAYLAAMNLFSFVLFGVDKHRAIKGRLRIPEQRLHFTALLGGFAGGAVGMRVFHHKTKKASFLIVYTFASLASCAAVVWAWQALAS